MGDEHLTIVPSDRAIEQAIIALKKGAHLLKYGRRGKPKVCPLRLSADEKFLIWYSGKKENQRSLSAVTDIMRGRNTVNQPKQLQAEMDSNCISLIYGNGDRTLDLICKDKMQAAMWFLGLRAVISRSRHGLVDHMKSKRGVQSCISSPVGYLRRKHNLGFSVKKSRFSQVRSLSRSPAQSFSERCSADGLTCSSDIFIPLSSVHNGMDNVIANSSPDDLSQKRESYDGTAIQNDMLTPSLPFTHESRLPGKYVLRDVFIWGEGAAGGCLGDAGEVKLDALLPKLLESTTMLDVQTISIGSSHAALVTKQGEVFCWGEGKNGRLGHKLDMDTACPKIIDSLIGVHVKSVSCSEFHTCALTTSGELYAWGDNIGADLVGEKKMRSYWLPNRVYGSLDGVKISYVACGEWHTGIVSTSGQLFTYGDGTFGVLGHGNLLSVAHPKEVESLKGLCVKSVACGPWHTAALVEISVHDHLKSNHLGVKLFTWGDGDKGNLGHSDNERKLLPTCVAQLLDRDFIQVTCASTLTVGLSSTGEVYTMGSLLDGQLSNPQNKDKSIDAVQRELKDELITEISSGSDHVAALTPKGNVYMWGKGSNGQLGLGDTKDRNCPTLVEALRNRIVEHIACGSNSTAAICLHKSISSTDQSICRGCGTTFRITRKKRNCYNCGLLFCRACCRKKTTNASLSSDKTKAFRVCDPCFCQLQRVAQSSRIVKEEGEESNIVSSRMMSTRNYYSEQWLDPIESLLDNFPRWGQVPCPEFLRRGRGHTKNSQDSASSIALNMKEKLSESNKFLLEEVSKLRTQLQTMSASLYLSRRETKEEALEEKKVDSLLASPIVFSNKYNTDDMEVEWVEEYQPGVFITFTVSPNKKKGIRRVKFSKEFTAKVAKKWWEENQLLVYQKYDAEGYTNMNQDMTN